MIGCEISAENTKPPKPLLGAQVTADNHATHGATVNAMQPGGLPFVQQRWVGFHVSWGWRPLVHALTLPQVPTPTATVPTDFGRVDWKPRICIRSSGIP
jgi:hypothetical protein